LTAFWSQTLLWRACFKITDPKGHHTIVCPGKDVYIGTHGESDLVIANNLVQEGLFLVKLQVCNRRLVATNIMDNDNVLLDNKTFGMVESHGQDGSLSVYGLTFTITTVPRLPFISIFPNEPSVVALLSMGVILLFVCFRFCAWYGHMTNSNANTPKLPTPSLINSVSEKLPDCKPLASETESQIKRFIYSKRLIYAKPLLDELGESSCNYDELLFSFNKARVHGLANRKMCHLANKVLREYEKGRGNEKRVKEIKQVFKQKCPTGAHVTPNQGD